MAQGIGRESYFWHKLHSLTGILPVGYYLVQHLTLNSFTLVSPAAFNGVIHFFEGLPKHLFLVMKYGFVWLPLIFHALYGLFIVMRADANYSNKAYKWRENRMYVLQRISGVVAFLFLCWHMATTSIAATIAGNTKVIEYASWQEKLTSNGYILFAVYVIGILASTYHLSYGIWNFCIRWGITVSEKSQARMMKVSAGAFIALTLLGWGALAGFLIHDPKKGTEGHQQLETSVESPLRQS